MLGDEWSEEEMGMDEGRRDYMGSQTNVAQTTDKRQSRSWSYLVLRLWLPFRLVGHG
jgi:hypothetical protein